MDKRKTCCTILCSWYKYAPAPHIHRVHTFQLSPHTSRLIPSQHLSIVSSTLVFEQGGWRSASVVAVHLHLAIQQQPMVSAGKSYYWACHKAMYLAWVGHLAWWKLETDRPPALSSPNLWICPKISCDRKQQHSFSARNRIPLPSLCKRNPSLVRAKILELLSTPFAFIASYIAT